MMRERRIVAWAVAMAVAMLAAAGLPGVGHASERPEPRAALAELGEAMARGNAETLGERVDLEAVWRQLARSLYDFVPEEEWDMSRDKLVSRAMESREKQVTEMLEAFERHYEGQDDLSGVAVPDAARLIPSVDPSEYEVSVDGDRAEVVIPVTGATEQFNQFWHGAGERIEALRLEMTWSGERWRVVGASVE